MLALTASLLSCLPPLLSPKTTLDSLATSCASTLHNQIVYNHACIHTAGADWVRPSAENTTCGCGNDDVECDYGFQKNGSSCLPLPKSLVPTCPLITSGYYSVSSTGKRLVHADVCTNVTTVIPDTDGRGTANGGGHTPAPGGDGKKHKRSGWFVCLLVIIITGGIGYVLWKYFLSQHTKQRALDAVSPVVHFLTALSAWLCDKLPFLRRLGLGGRQDDLSYFQPLGDSGHDDDARVFTLR